MRNTLETRLGLFFALAVIAAVFVLELAGGRNLFNRGIPIRTRFTNIQELKAGDSVKMAGVEIGTVTKVELADQKVEVTMNLKKDAKVKTDSVATIKFMGLLGQNFIAIDFGTPGAPLAARDAMLQSKETSDLSSLMVKLDTVASGVEGLARNFSGENFNNLLGPFTDFLKENSPRLSAILGNLQVVSSQIAQGQGTVGKLISDDTLYTAALGAVTNLNATAGDVKSLMDEAKLTLDQAKTVVTDINKGQGTIGKLIKDEALYNETSTAMINLRQILEKINRGEGSVGKLVNDDSLFKNAKLTLQKLDKATEGLEDQGPLSVLGIAVNSLF
jgi:phospholipid/cholesterol/gamma-HCH transport system substrate-binding protein